MADGDGVLPPMTIWAYNPPGNRGLHKINTAIEMGKKEYLIVGNIRDVFVQLGLKYTSRLYCTKTIRGNIFSPIFPYYIPLKIYRLMFISTGCARVPLVGMYIKSLSAATGS
jgi:hypothetical protein